MTLKARVLIVALVGALGLAAPALAQSTQQLLKPEQLDQLVAPIALYSDPLLAQVLMGSTYPLEVVQADRWAQTNKNLRGDQITAALAKQSWDDSIKALVQVPSVLAMMSAQLDWTQKLGDAMLAQQADLMDAVQRLRVRAQANGKLQTTKQQTVTAETEGQKQYVVIQPSSPTEIYVPYYEPAVVYGAWPYPAYPPYYWPPPPGYVAAGVLATGIAFGAGVAVGHAIWGNCDWGRHNINVVNRNVNINNVTRNDFSRWEHNADHRHGVKYNNDAVRQKYARTDVQAGRDQRQDFRGRDGEKVLDPDRDQRDAGDRANRGERDRAGESERLSGAGQRSRDNAFSHIDSGARTGAHSERGRESFGGGGGGRRVAGGGEGRGGGRGGGRR
jgi:hypothetical protein